MEAKLQGRVHFHWKVDLAEAINHWTVNVFRFHEIGPDVRTPWQAPGEEVKQARGSSYAEAVNRGHFYCRGHFYPRAAYAPRMSPRAVSPACPACPVHAAFPRIPRVPHMPLLAHAP